MQRTLLDTLPAISGRSTASASFTPSAAGPASTLPEKWDVTIKAPLKSFYSALPINLSLHFPSQWPAESCSVVFCNKIYHPECDMNDTNMLRLSLFGEISVAEILRKVFISLTRRVPVGSISKQKVQDLIHLTNLPEIVMDSSRRHNLIARAQQPRAEFIEAQINEEMAHFQRVTSILDYSRLVRHPNLFQPFWSLDFLAPELSAALKTTSPEALRALIREEIPGLAYSLPLLNQEVCGQLISEMKNMEAAKHINKMRPNSMNNYGVIVDDMGLEAPMRWLMLTVVQPLSKLLFCNHAPEGDGISQDLDYMFGGSRLDTHHAFVVKYRPDEDRALSMHTDDSEITLNISLNEVSPSSCYLLLWCFVLSLL
jgi:ubiquitin-protein ligase